MWCLPSLSKINEEAARNADKHRRAVETGELEGKRICCEYCREQADSIYLWYDIFSEDAKGVLGLCSKHAGYYGSPAEGFFTCDDCGRVFIENYTWELYGVSNDDGVFCLNCHAKREIETDENWIPLTDDAIAEIDFDDLRRAKHLQAVGQGTPKGLVAVETVEMDSSCGGRLTSCSTCESGPEGALEEIRSILKELQAVGVPRALLILSAAFQFSVAVSICVDANFADQTKGVSDALRSA